MANDLSTEMPRLPGLLPDLDVAELLGTFSAMQDGEKSYVDRMPTREERFVMDKRLIHLNSALRPTSLSTADKEKAGKMIALLLNGFPSLARADVAGMTVAYVLHLQEFPLFAIMRSCQDVINRRVPGLSLDWPPSSVRLGDMCERHVDALAAERHKLRLITAAKALIRPTEAPGAKARVEKMRQEAMAVLKSATDRIGGLLSPEERLDIRMQAIDRSRREIARAWKSLGREPMTISGTMISPELAVNLGLMRRER